MAIRDSIRDAGLAESQNFATIEVLMVTKASGTAWEVAPASKGAAGKVAVIENAILPVATLQKILTGANGVLSASASIKATNLSAYFAAVATDLNFAVGGLAGISASSVVSAEVEFFDAVAAKSGAATFGPADVVLTSSVLTIASGDLALDNETGTVVGKIAIGAYAVTADAKAILKLRVKL